MRARWLLLSLLAACGGPAKPAPPSAAIAQCRAASDCAAPSQPCVSSVCVDGRCETRPSAPGPLPDAQQVAGDCRRATCEGGAVVSRDDPADVPAAAPSSPCLVASCRGGAPREVPAPEGTACGKSGSCDATGACVTIKQLSAGRHHTCVVLSNGDVRCWGSNESGQLGAVVADLSIGARKVALPRRAVSVTAGGDHSCALLDQGEIACWGSNAHGQIGVDGDAHPSAALVTIAKATAVAAGMRHTCAIVAGGSVACWGAFGSDTSRAPAPVGIDDAIAIGAGHDTACALKRSGGVACWGINDHGQLGAGDKAVHKKPVSARASGAAEIAVGRAHACVRDAAGKVACWGWNQDGQVGVTGRAEVLAPVEQKGLVATAITAGNGHSCAMVAGGKATCWGWNQDGQLGDGTFATTHERKSVIEVGEMIAIAAGSRHTCALLPDGEVSCFGRNDRGQLGGARVPRVVRD